MDLATPSSPANPSTKQELAGVDAGAPGLASLFLGRLRHPGLYLMIIIYFLHNCAAYGCMTFLSRTLNNQGFSKRQYGWLFAIPYVVAAIIMVLNSRHSDKTLERRGHVAAVYLLSGTSLILSVALSGHFWISFGLMCLAIPGPFAALAPFWAIPGETMPRPVMGLVIGLVNAFGNVGGYVGPKLAGLLTKKLGSLEVPFAVLGAGMLIAGGLSFLLPRRQPVLAYSQE
jgi:predicted MFS family arabinose efflux permease